MWKRDPGVAAMIEHLDRAVPSRLKMTEEDWACLPSIEKFEMIGGLPDGRKLKEAMMEQARECANDFSYAARNYFWITTKKKKSQLFSLWESQYLILDKYYELKAKGKAQKIIIIKARQLGCSSLIEAMIAWRAMFYPNTRAIVVSVDQNHSSYLFGYMLYIYDNMPWWLKPMQASRKEEKGLFFENEDPALRSRYPGMNSKVMVQWSNQYSGVGQGIAIDAAHCCFSPDTRVRLAGGDLIDIVDVKPGDVVVTGCGRPMPVKGVYKSNRKNEESAKLTLWGMSQIPLETTLDHRILTPDGYRKAGELRAGDFVSVPIRKINGSQSSVFLSHNQTGGGANIRSRKSTIERVECDFGLGWICGFYLAEGTVHLNKRLQERFQPDSVYLSIHKKEEESVKRHIGEVFKGQHVGVYHAKSQACILKVSNSALARFLYLEFGYGSGKTIPSWAWESGREFCRGIVCGYLEGDGHLASDGIVVNAQSTRSAILIQLRDMVASLGYGWSSINFRPAGEWYGRNCKEIWIWNACGGTGVALRGDMGWVVGTRQIKSPPHWAFDQQRGQIAVSIAKVGRGHCEEFYDLEVDAIEHNFCTIQCAVANSEFTDYDEDDLEAIVNEDLGNSMADEPEVFGFMESTGRGAGGAAHKLWRACERRLDLGKWPKWYPLFLPSFFETTRVLAPPQGWSIQGPEIVMRERAKKEWLRCDNQACGRYRKVTLFGESTVGAPCPSCNLGALVPMVLNDDQCFWHQDNREQAEEQGEKAKKQWLQEQAVTGEEAFQVSGYVMFNDSCREWVGSTIDNSPRRKGKIYRETGEIHGAGGLEGRCYVNGCNVDHRHDETPYTEWEEPQPDRLYTIGVDVSEGIGQDYSVIFVNKIGRALGEPDEQVALWRDNHTKPKELAFYCNVIGLWYNQAMMCIEYNTYQTTGDDVVYVYQYPNVFRWKNKETINPLTHKWHWWTKVNTKAYLHQTAVDWLLSRAWVIRSANYAKEMTTYRKEEFDTRSFGAEEGFHDDELIAGMIALYCSHELDCDEVGRVRVPSLVEVQKPARYRCYCNSCRYGEAIDPDGKWPWVCDNPEREYRCPSCGSIRLVAVSLEIQQQASLGYEGLMSLMGKRPEGVACEPRMEDL